MARSLFSLWNFLVLLWEIGISSKPFGLLFISIIALIIGLITGMTYVWIAGGLGTIVMALLITIFIYRDS